MTLAFSVQPFGEIDADLAAATMRFFAWKDGDAVLAHGGEVLPVLGGDRVYIWLVLNKKDLSRGQLRKGKKIIQEYLASLPWTPYAEVCFEEKQNERFLAACGFSYVCSLGDRMLFRWGN